MRAVVLGVLAVGVLAGCETMSQQHYVETMIDAQGKSKQVVVNLRHARSGAIQGSDNTIPIRQWCPIEALDVAKDILDTTQCTSEHTHVDGMTRLLATDMPSTTITKAVVPAAIMGGSIIGAATVLRPARTEVTQNGGGASATGGAASASAAASAKANTTVNTHPHFIGKP